MKVFLLLLFFMTSAFANDIYHFNTPAQSAHFDQLLSELRCLVCQNEDLGASNAPLAADLRQQVYQMMVAGKNDHEIKNYLQMRYGSFVLYKPPVQMNTLLLWSAPFILIVIGFALLVLFLRRKGQNELTVEQQQRLKELLK